MTTSGNRDHDSDQEQKGVSDGRIGWDEWAMGIAFAVARRADCRRRLVGAVILDNDHRVVSTGYNGTASGKPGCLQGSCPRGMLTLRELPAGSDYDRIDGYGYCIATHAEMNAMLYVDPFRMRDATMYVTCKPCRGCSKIIANTPISRIVYPVSTNSNQGLEEILT
jgi:dCMP deaminase